MHRYMLATGERFRFYLQRISSRNDQETSFGAGVLDGRAQEPVDEFFENHLARKCLRSFDHARWTRRTLVLPQPRMELVELPYFSIGSPSKITLPCVS